MLKTYLDLDFYSVFETEINKLITKFTISKILKIFSLRFSLPRQIIGPEKKLVVRVLGFAIVKSSIMENGWDVITIILESIVNKN